MCKSFYWQIDSDASQLQQTAELCLRLILERTAMFTVSHLSLIQCPPRSGWASLRADLSAVPRSAQAESAHFDISSLAGRLPSMGLPAAAHSANAGAETARTAESPRACQPRDGPETSDADSATGPPVASPDPVPMLALPARALPRPVRPTAVALHASLNDPHRGAEIPGTDVASDPLASQRAGRRLPLPGGGASPSSSPQGDACAKTGLPRETSRAIAIPDATVTGISTSLGKGWQKRRKYQTPLSAICCRFRAAPRRSFFQNGAQKLRRDAGRSFRISGQNGAQKFRPRPRAGQALAPAALELARRI
jgi:hypothetical protein